VSVKRKSKLKKPRASSDIRIQGVSFKDALRAILNAPPMNKSKHPR
jgi:hypothetical protein